MERCLSIIFVLSDTPLIDVIVPLTSLDVVAQKGNKMRGQAFVVYEEISAATAAMRALVGEEFYGRPLVSFRSKERRRDSMMGRGQVRGIILEISAGETCITLRQTVGAGPAVWTFVRRHTAWRAS